jgi:CO/xanthine dehydrogenase FAD-binding subunit
MNPVLEVLRPRTIGEAARLLGRHGDARLLAGGQSLIAAMKTGLSDPSHLIDLRSLIAAHPELDTIRDDGDALWIGAMTPHHRVATSPVVRRRMPMLARLAAGIADSQIRHRGTIGGSVALHDPAACWPAGVLATDATIITQQRTLRAAEFFTGVYGTALEADEIILGLHFPAGRQGVYLKSEQKASRFALLGVAVTAGPDMPGTRVAITGLGHGVRRWLVAEQLLDADFRPETLLAIELPEEEAASDLHATARYRANLARVLAIRAVASLTGRPAPAAPPNDSLRRRLHP